MTRIALMLAAFSLSLAAASAQTPLPAPTAQQAAVAALDEPVPRAARAEARRDCLAENVALSGEDLRAAMRDCMQGRFPGVQLYARDGLTRDGRPTAASARALCKSDIDGRGLSGAARTAALTACFAAKRPDLAAAAECRKEARLKGLDDSAMRGALSACGRLSQS